MTNFRREATDGFKVVIVDVRIRGENIFNARVVVQEIGNQNFETVRRLTPSVRHRATYDRSLSVLKKAKEMRGATIYTKSGLMLGLGEREAEVWQAMADLRASKCDILTLGQYLQPTLKHLPVIEFVPPAKFAEYKTHAETLGFVHVASGPLVRSSYHADEFKTDVK